MNQKEIIEVIDAVDSIQYNIYELTEDEGIIITFHGNGAYFSVTFLDEIIWDTEDKDKREYVETNNGTDGYYTETIETYLWRRIREEITKLNKLLPEEETK